MNKGQITFKVSGTSPLILHNGQTADPLNQYSKRMKMLSGKRAKTDADFQEMARTEFEAGLYLNKEGHVILPAIVLEAAIVSGAKKQRLGKAVQAGLYVLEDAPLIFPDAAMTVDELWECGRYRFSVPVKVQMSKVIRTRPKFDEWALEFTVIYYDDILNEADVRKIITDTGDLIGLCDWRPRFGRFEVVK